MPTAVPESFFLTVEDTRVFASLHAPAGAGRGVGLVVCPPLADEHIASYRTLYQLGDRLAALGVPVLRFDPPGHGDSEGEFDRATPARMSQIARHAARIVEDACGGGRVGFLGVRLGCASALLAAEARPDAFGAAWAPVLAADRYFGDLLRRQVLSDVMYGGSRRSVREMLADLGDGVDIGGYMLGTASYESHVGFEVDKAIGSLGNEVLVIQQTIPSAGVPRRRREELAASAPHYHESDEEIFWAFPREGSLPPTPERWFEVTIDWVLDRSSREES